MTEHRHDGAPLPERQPRVLLVDDDPVNLLLTGAALRERGFTVVEAEGGLAALQQLADWLPDVIVLDAMMPGLDGFEICRELRDLPGFELLPVLMLTGLEDEDSIERAFEVGATDFFIKSSQWALLAARLHYLLRAARVQTALRRSQSRLSRAQDLARMGSFEWQGDQGLVLEPEALRVLGRGPGVPLSLGEAVFLIAPVQRRLMIARVRDALRQGCVVDCDVAIRGDRVLHIEAEPQFDEQGRLVGYGGILQDVTDRRLAEDKIRELANVDALTGLPNRRQLIWRAGRALEAAQRLGHACALLLIDLDRFKNINDTLGHARGDELLIEIGRRLRRCLNHCDQIADPGIDGAGLRSHRALEAVGRLGGDEFVALLPEVGEAGQALRVADAMLQTLREPVLLEGREYFVTASIGIGLYPHDGGSVVDLLRHADIAMYAAKAEGRNARQRFHPDLIGRSREKLETETALHKALERGELVLHYQPKIDAVDGRVRAVEALMRWRRDGAGLIQPSDFIPVAEETGLILPMSAWAIAEAARQVAAWRDHHGIALAVAVNLPSRSFERLDLVEQLQAATRAFGLPAQALQLEITETGLMRNIDQVVPVLHRLRQSGVEIAIDDFGTGYSSLSYLTQLPIRELKIDRSFVRHLGEREQSTAVVTAVLALARSLRLRVVAEGVETELQERVLRELGCDTMQGQRFAAPMPADALVRWLDRWRVRPV
ncbi:MAG: hypothetical protein RLZZ592_2268 [Pseudomonadota bacterium]